MAFVFDTWKVNVVLVDTGGNVTNREYINKRGSGATLTQLDGDITALLIALQAVTDAVPKQYNLTRVTIQDALALPAAAEVEAHALITAPLHGRPNKSATIDIPAPNVGIFVATSGAGYNTVDPTDALLIAYLDLWTDGNAANQWTISDGETIDQVNVKGKRTHSHSTKG